MKRVISDTAYIGVIQALSMVATLGLQILVVRTLNLEAYGQYTLAAAFVTIVETVFVARGGELALQYVGKYWSAEQYGSARACARQIIRLDARLNWQIYFALVASAFALGPLFQMSPMYVAVLGLSIPAQIGYGVHKSVFIATGRLKAQASFEISIVGLYSGLGLIGILCVGIWGLLMAVVISALLKNLIAWRVTRSYWPKVETSSPVDITNELRSFGMHSVLRNSLSVGASNLDVLILGAARGTEAVAVYKVAKSISALPARVSAPVWSALRPRMMKAWHTGDRHQLLRCMSMPATGLIILGAIMAWPAIWLADDLLGALYGPEFRSANVAVLALLVGTWLYSAVTAWFGFWVVISERREAGSILFGIQFLLTLVAAIVFGRASVDGMAAAMSIVLVTTSFLCWGLFLTALPRSRSNSTGI